MAEKKTGKSIGKSSEKNVGTNAEKITDLTEVSTTELASVLGITARRVQQMAQDGTILAARRGKFNLAKSIQRYIEFISSKDKMPDDLEVAKQIAEVELKEAKAQVAQLELKELQGQMHRSEDVEAMTRDMLYTIRGMLISVPGRLAPLVTEVSSPAEASKIIRVEIHKVMEELSKYQYDPKRYEEKVRERRDWSAAESDVNGE